MFSFAYGPSGLRLRQFEWSSLSLSGRSGKRRKDPLKLVIVREGEAPGRLWVTGFNEPCRPTMYVYKPMDNAVMAEDPPSPQGYSGTSVQDIFKMAGLERHKEGRYPIAQSMRRP